MRINALRTAACVATLLSAGVILYVTLTPSPPGAGAPGARLERPGQLRPLPEDIHLPPREISEQLSLEEAEVLLQDNLGHFLLFIPLGAGAALWWATISTSRRSARRTLLMLVLAPWVFAAVTELAQAYVGRDADLADWFADMAGALTGLFGGMSILNAAMQKCRGLAVNAAASPSVNSRISRPRSSIPMTRGSSERRH